MDAAGRMPKYVDPLPKEFYDEEERFIRDVIERASEIPPDELERLRAEYHKRQWPYVQKGSKAYLAYLAELIGLDPKEFKKPPRGPGFAKDVIGRYVDGDPVEMVRAARERMP